MLQAHHREILRHLKGLKPQDLDAVLNAMRAAEPHCFHAEGRQGEVTLSNRVFFHRPASNLPMKGYIVDSDVPV